MEKKKRNLIVYGIVSIILAVIIIAAVVIYHFEESYKLSPEEALAEMKLKDNFIDPVSFQDTNMANTIFIDLRSSHEYNYVHLENAINIPAEKIMSQEYLENIRQIEENGNTIILYGNTPQQVAGTWLLLKQVGIKNIKMYSGSFEQLTSKDPVKITVLNEVPVIDTSLLNKPDTVEIKSPKPPKPKKEVVPLRVEPAPESGGGC